MVTLLLLPTFSFGSNIIGILRDSITPRSIVWAILETTPGENGTRLNTPRLLRTPSAVRGNINMSNNHKI